MSLTPAQQIQVARASGYRCYICGQGRDPLDPFQYEHIRSKKFHGSDEIENMRLAHGSCNNIKGSDWWTLDTPLDGL